MLRRVALPSLAEELDRLTLRTIDGMPSSPPPRPEDFEDTPLPRRTKLRGQGLDKRSYHRLYNREYRARKRLGA